jgi:tetratricopeptide (TPR) repeat protein
MSSDMECYRCGGRMFSGNRCLGCGADIAVFRRIVRASNSCYNSALEKARVRDLTGAAAMLRKSLQLYKKNTQARNLLGLICYERGELTSALTQWIISSELDRRDRRANELINEAFGDKAEFERMNSATKKYNLALKNARNGNEDFAIVALRRIVSQNPNMIKADELLALLYMHKGEYAKAYRVLKKALTIDRGSTTCQRYMAEARRVLRHKKRVARRKEEAENQGLSRDGFQDTEPAEGLGTRMAMIGLLAGVMISMLGYFALIRPAQLSSINREWGEKLIMHDERISDKIAEAGALENEMEGLQAELEEAKQSLDRYTGDEGIITNYEKLLLAANAYINSDWPGLIEDINGIDASTMDSEVFNKIYSYLDSYVHSGELSTRYYESGMNKFAAAQYSAAISDFETSYEMNQSNAAALFRIGLCYEALNNDGAARPYFQKIVDEFPDSEFAELAKIRL